MGKASLMKDGLKLIHVGLADINVGGFDAMLGRLQRPFLVDTNQSVQATIRARWRSERDPAHQQPQGLRSRRSDARYLLRGGHRGGGNSPQDTQSSHTSLIQGVAQPRLEP